MSLPPSLFSLPLPLRTCLLHCCPNPVSSPLTTYGCPIPLPSLLGECLCFLYSGVQSGCWSRATHNQILHCRFKKIIYTLEKAYDKIMMSQLTKRKKGETFGSFKQLDLSWENNIKFPIWDLGRPKVPMIL